MSQFIASRSLAAIRGPVVSKSVTGPSLHYLVATACAFALCDVTRFSAFAAEQHSVVSSHQALVACTQPAVYAAGNSAKNSTQAITALEQKLFRHTFTTDTDDVRIARLERMTLGAESTLPKEARIARLSATAINAVNAVPLQDQTCASRSKLSAKETLNLTLPAPTPTTRALPNQTYPRVNALERLILGPTFVDDQIADRMRRLELSVFGLANESDGLLSRVEKIETHKHVESVYLLMDNREVMTVESLSNYLKRKPSAPHLYAQFQKDGATVVDWIDMLESQTTGKTAPQDPLLNRVSSIERKLFTYPDDTNQLLPRIHKIWAEINPEPLAVASLDGANSSKEDAMPLTERIALKVPINPEMQKPADPSVDGFQLPANPSMSKTAVINEDGSENQTSSTAKKSGFFGKVGKLLIGDGAPIWGSDLWY